MLTGVPGPSAATGFPFGHKTRRSTRTPLRPSGRLSWVTARRGPGRATTRARTSHSPAVTSLTRVVTETGPLPGRTPSTVSSRSKRSPRPGAPVIPVRRPVNLTVTGPAGPLSPGSSQQVAVSTCPAASRSRSPRQPPGPAGAGSGASGTAAVTQAGAATRAGATGWAGTASRPDTAGPAGTADWAALAGGLAWRDLARCLRRAFDPI